MSSKVSFIIDKRIIRDIYDTPEEAIKVAQELGSGGYRTYVIDGARKYVPCTSYVEYENALRFHKLQGKLGVFGSDTFGDKLVGYQFANSKDEIQGDPFFTLGNFSINKNISLSPTDERQQQLLNIRNLNKTTQPLTSYNAETIIQTSLPSYTGQDYINTLVNRINNNLNVEILFDKRKLDKYVSFSSLKERFKNCFIEIYNNFPAALKASVISFSMPTVKNYYYNPTDNQAELIVNINTTSNPFNIEYYSSGTTVSNEVLSKHRNFSLTYNDYVLLYNNVEYPIISCKLPSEKNDGIKITVVGNPFISNPIINEGFYLKPKQEIYDEFYNSLSDLSKFLLNIDLDTQTYVTSFIYPKLSESGEYTEVKETLFFPMYDNINIDLFTNNFDLYLKKLNDIADNYDNLKTNIVSRFLITNSLKEFDTEDRKFNLILQLYSKQFDDIKKYIDGISYMRNVSYNKIENIPDLLIKNFVQTLGLETYNIEDEKTLIESLFKTDVKSTTNSKTPAEIDIELWRRIFINAFYLFKSKGTRKSIDFILKLVGLPIDIFELNEYVYLANQPLNVSNVLNKIYENQINDDPNTLLERVPFDIDGFPTVPVGVIYQEDGGYIDENNENIGEYDFGKRYINEYKKYNNIFLFELDRVTDNIKSYVYNNIPTHHYSNKSDIYTDYYVNDDRLIVNSKEVEVLLSSNRILDISIYRKYNKNIITFDEEFNKKVDIQNISFNQYLKSVITNLISPTDRKIVNTYPSLRKIYLDYLNTTNNPMTNTRSLEFLNKFDSSWVNLIKQFIPATSILTAGKKIENSILIDNKFKYQRGISDGSEFQNKTLKPVYLGSNNIIENRIKLNQPIKNKNYPTISVNSNIGLNIFGSDDTYNEYLGYYLTIQDFCNNENGVFFIWEDGIDYLDPKYNYTGSTGEYLGVYVIYNDKIYRLKDNVTNVTGMTITTPNLATDGTDELIWDLIPNNNNIIDYINNISGITTKEQKTYIFNSISKARAYLNINANFICPPPKPHVGYFNITGNTIDMSAFDINFKPFVDEYGITQYIKQPKYYGYSKDIINNKTTTYKKPFPITTGVTYYKDEYLEYDGNTYLVTGDTVEFTGLTNLSGLTTEIEIQPGLYESYTGRTMSDPLMHINPAYITKYDINPKTDRYSINLSKSLNLKHIFYNENPLETFVAKDKIVDNNIFISDDLELTFDGLYAINQYKVGPFYTQNIDETFIHTLEDKINLTPNSNNYVSIRSLNENFKFISDDIGLSNNRSSGYYLVKKNSFLTFEFSLYFTSNYNVEQLVTIQLLNSSVKNNNIYYEEEFSFIGDDILEYRVCKLKYNGFFNSGDKIYLNIIPKDLDCTINRYEEINYEYEKPNEIDIYDELNDPRFRVLFNSGFSGKGVTVDGLSIKPITPLIEVDNYLHLAINSNSYVVKPILKAKKSLDPNLLANKLFMNYYQQYIGDEIITNSIIYDKQVNFDKIDFEFVVNSKNNNDVLVDSKYESTTNTFIPPTTTKLPFNTINRVNRLEGFKAQNVEIKLSFKDYYLGLNPPQTEYNDVTNAITIGKNIQQRLAINNRSLDYINELSYINNSEYLSGVTESNNIEFKSCDNGLKDYLNINYSNNIANEILNLNRHIIGTFGESNYGIFDLGNKVYNTEIYQQLLEKVPLFNPRIINYQLNDIVKVQINNYKVVVDTPTGKTIETKPVYRLYVCVNDIHTNHCYQEFQTKDGIDDGVISKVIGEIHEIYRPRGSRSCFVKLEDYNPSKFTPWGYEQFSLLNHINTNIYDYITKITNLTGTINYNTFKYGEIYKITTTDIITTGTTTDLYRFIYKKPLVYNSDRDYQRGDYIISGGTFNICDDPTIGISGFTEITGLTFVNNKNVIDFNSYNDKYVIYAPTAYRHPKTLTIDRRGNILYFIPSGNTTNNQYAYIDNVYIPLEEKEIQVFNKPLLLTSGLTSSIAYSGPLTNTNITGGTITYLYSEYEYENDNYNDFYGNTLKNKTNIYLTPSYPTDRNLENGLYINPTYSDSADINPLFEKLCSLSEQNNPVLATGVTGDTNGLYLGQKYYIHDNVLHYYNGDVRDFCLVNKFTFYKDMVSLKVYEHTMESLTEEIKQNMYFLTPSLNLKNGFTTTSFSGNTNDEKLQNGVDLFYDVTDVNRRDIKKWGNVQYEIKNNDIILHYYYNRDQLNYPVTGEFIGRLLIKNPCGHNACCFFGLVFDISKRNIFEVSNLSLLKPSISVNNNVVLPYITRLIINGSNNINIVIKYFDINGNIITENENTNKLFKYNKIINVIPETDCIIEVSYNINNNQTTFDSATLNNTPLFENNLNTNNSLVETQILTNDNNRYQINENNILNVGVSVLATQLEEIQPIIETRVIRLKSVNRDNVIFINLKDKNNITVTSLKK